MDELNDSMGTQLPEDEAYDTLAGFLFDQFGHIPTAGERLTLEGISMKILAADDRRIRRVELILDEQYMAEKNAEGDAT